MSENANPPRSSLLAGLFAGWVGLACAGLIDPVALGALGADKVCACDTLACAQDEFETWQLYRSNSTEAIAALSREDKVALDGHERRMASCLQGR